MLKPIKEEGINIVSDNILKRFEDFDYCKIVEIKNCVVFGKYLYSCYEHDMYSCIRLEHVEELSNWVCRCSLEELYYNENNNPISLGRSATFITSEILKLINDTITEFQRGEVNGSSS